MTSPFHYSLLGLTIQTPVRGGSVQIASSSKCPNATQSDTLWCVRLASKAINATACLQPGGGVTTSKAGQLLKMAANMAVDLESGSLVIEVASEIYTYALVTAITTTEECISTTHSAIFLQSKCQVKPVMYFQHCDVCRSFEGCRASLRAREYFSVTQIPPVLLVRPSINIDVV